MILSPTAPQIGVQPHASVARMVNKSGGALAIGDVVITSFNHTSSVYPATTTAEAYLSPFACVKKADGNASAASGNGAHANCGILGVVVDLGSYSGADNTEVVVQIGGVCKASVNPSTNNAVIGSKLFVSDSAGEFTNEAGSSDPDTLAAIALETKAHSSAGLIWVVLAGNGDVRNYE